MEDEKLLRDCRVVVTDLRSILPETMLPHLSVEQQDYEEVEIISDEDEGFCISSEKKTTSCLTEFSRPASVISVEQSEPTNMQLKNDKPEINESKTDLEGQEVCENDPKVKTSVKKYKNLNIYKKRRLLMKTRKRRRHSVNSHSTTSTANQAKNHLLQKYGSTLLRKPSLLVNPEMLTETSSNQLGSCKTLSNTQSDIDAVSVAKTNDSKLEPLHFSEDNLSSLQNSNPKLTEEPAKNFHKQNLITNSNVIENLSLGVPSNSGLSSNLAHQNSNSQRTAVSCPMPPVGLTLNVGIGCKLPTLQAKCVLTCLEKCQTSLSPQFAEFSSSVVKAATQPPVAKVLIPIDDERVLQFMRIKWQSRPSLQRIALSKLQSSPVETLIDLTKEDKNLLDVDKIASKVLSEIEDKNSVSANDNISQESECDKQVVSDQKNIIRKPRRRKRKSPLVSKSDDNNQITSDVDNLKSEEDVENLQKLPRKRVRLTLITGDKDKFMNTTEDKGNNLLLKKRLRCADTNFQNLSDSDDETRNITLTTVQKFPIPIHDPDDTRGVSSTETVTEGPREVTRAGMKSHVMHELRRLNVAVFDMPNNQEPITCRTSDVCRLGCVCSSLLTRPVRDHCGLEQCMFGCVCIKHRSNRQSNSDPSFTWMQNKAKANLAKEEQHFKQTVVRSGKDGLVLVEGRRKREIKLPNRYREDFVADQDLKLCRQFGSMQSMKGVREAEAQVADKDNSQLRQSKKPTGSRDGSTSIAEKECHEVTDSLDTSTESETFESQSSNVSARTIVFDYKSKEDRQDKQKQHLKESSCEKIGVASDLKIVSAQSVNPDEWEKSNNKVDTISNLELSCSALFKPSSNTENKHVRLLSWSGLKKDIDQRNAFIWIKSAFFKPKIYLTCSDEKPTENCVDVQSIDLLSQEYKDFPFHMKSLRSDYTLTESEGKCVWIVKYIKNHWMIVGYMQQGQKKPTLCKSPEVDVFSFSGDKLCHRWWVMDTRQIFDLIYFMDFKKAITKHQILTLVKLSNEYSESETKMHRILLNRRRPKIDPRPTPYPDFGAYSLPNRPTEVFIGPYDYSKEPRFHVYAQRVLHSEKIEYEKVPLFYCGGGEFVRVNAQGALSLHTEKPPEKYVKGMWYESSGTEFRCLDNQTVIDEVATEQVENESFPQIDFTSCKETNEPKAISEKSSTSCGYSENCESNGSEDESVKTWSESSKDSTEKPTDRIDESIKSVMDTEKIKPVLSVTKHSIETEIDASVSKKISCTPTLSNVLIDKCPQAATSLETKTNGTVESPIDDCQDLPELLIEYLVPSVRAIGVLPITYLPTSAMSVPHFTQPGLLQFFHTREELIQELNRLIHYKLACLHQKCCVVLKRNDICRCIAWKTVWNKEKCAHLPQFSPEIFNGYFMLTKYGLLDIRTTDDKSLRKLGEDWIDWLKQDELSIKLSAWEQQDRNNHDFSNLSLPRVLSLAIKDEMLKPGNVVDPAHYDNEAKTQIRDILLASLSRKLNGIPGSVLPNFLELVDLDILWASQQSLNSPTTAVPYTARQSHIKPAGGNVKTSQPSFKNHSSNPNMSMMFKSGLIVKEINQIPEKSADKDEKVGSQQQLQNQNKEQLKVKLTPSPRKDIVNSKDGLACRLSPFSRLNICVEEGGIKYTPFSSPPRPSSPVGFLPEIQTSPGKQPNILKRNKNGLPDFSPSKCVSSFVNCNIKQARKQTFSSCTDNDEEPEFLEEPENNDGSLGSSQSLSSKIENNLSPGINLRTSTHQMPKPTKSTESALFEGSPSPSAVISFLKKRDHEPPLRISSVGSGASYWHDLSETALPSSQDKCVEVDPPPVPCSDSTPNLQISSVYSTNSLFPSPFSTPANVDPVSSLQISSVVSVAPPTPSAILMQHGLKRPFSFTTSRKVIKADSIFGVVKNNHVANDRIPPGANSESVTEGALQSQHSSKVDSSVEAAPKSTLQNAGNATKQIKVFKKGSGTVTVTVPVSSLKMVPSSSVNRTFQST